MRLDDCIFVLWTLLSSRLNFYLNMQKFSRPPGFSPFICTRQISARATQFSEHCPRSANPSKCWVLRSKQDPVRLYSNAVRSYCNRYTSNVVFKRGYAHAAAAEVDTQSERPNDAHIPGPCEIPEDLEKLTVRELKSLLSARGLKVSGLKAELISRLRENAPEPDVNRIDIPVTPRSVSPEAQRPDETGALSEELLGKLELDLLHNDLFARLMTAEISQFRLLSDASQVAAALATDRAALVAEIGKIERDLQLNELSNRLLIADLTMLHLHTDSSSFRDRLRQHQQRHIDKQVKKEKSSIATAEIVPKPPLIPRPFSKNKALADARTRLRRSGFLIGLIEKRFKEILSPSQKAAIYGTTPQSEAEARSLTRGREYFARVFALNETKEPDASTKDMDFSQFSLKHREHLLETFFLPIIRRMAEKKEVSKEHEFKTAWELAVDRFSRNAGRHYIHPSKLPAPFVEPPPPTKLKDTQVQEEPLTPLEEMSRVSKSLRHKWDILKLVSKPVDIQLTITPRLRQNYLPRAQSKQISSLPLVANPMCQIFAPMWKQLRLTTHISFIRQGPTEYDFIVTFKTFDAASAFVNRCDEHWIDDKFSGQVYARWDPGPKDPPFVNAIVTFPRTSLEVWREVAMRDGAPLGKYGFPNIDWGRSLASALRRMGYKVGGREDVRRYEVLSEYPYRLVMEVSFKDTDTLNRFLQRNREHYLTNPWKDRFFAKAQSLVGYLLPCYFADRLV